MDSVKKNFEQIYSRLADYLNGEDGKKATMICMNDFGGYSVMQCRIHKAELCRYAQYANCIAITFTPIRKRTKYKIFLHEGKSFAIFADWVTPTAKIGTETKYGRMWTGFDNNELYKLIDSVNGEKLGEQSERLYIEELKQVEKVFKVYGTDGGKTYATEAELLEHYTKAGEIADSVRRFELQGAPILKELCGPMYDGTDGSGRACIRYETSELNRILSA